MGGIAGYIHVCQGRVSSTILARMLSAMGERGPDGDGFVALDTPDQRLWSLYRAKASGGPPSRARLGPSARIGLGEQRLHLGEVGDRFPRPYVSSDGRFTLALDGTIYNRQDLRRHLSARGCHFRGGCDAEVITEAFRSWGADCFARFNGVWALALYDQSSDLLLLSRDPLGVRPLHWAMDGQVLYFASEIKGLLAVPAIGARRAVDRPTAARWLLHGVRDAGTATFFEGIRRVPPACFIAAERGWPARGTSYWHIPRHRLERADLGPGEAAATLRDLIADAAVLRRPPDGAPAITLESGFDLGGAALAAMAGRMSGARARSYANDVADPSRPLARSGLQFVARAAETARIGHQVVPVHPLTPWREITSLVARHEEPLADPTLGLLQTAWEPVAGHGSALHGAGAEELFALRADLLSAAALDDLLAGKMQTAAAILWGDAKSVAPRRRAGFMAGALAQALRRRVGLGHPWGPPHGLPRAISAGLQGRRLDPHRAGSLQARLVEDVLATALPARLSGLDRAGMGVPLDVRLPFLDPRIVDFACRIPAAYLTRDGWSGWILRRAMSGLLPPEVVWRRRRPRAPLAPRAWLQRSRPLVEMLLRDSAMPWFKGVERGRLRPTWPLVSFLLWYDVMIAEESGLVSALEAQAHDLSAGAQAPFPSWRPIRAPLRAARRAA